MTKKLSPSHASPGGTPSKPELVTLAQLAERVGAASAESRDDLYESADVVELQDRGRQVESSTLLGAVSTFVVDVMRIEPKLTAAQRERLVGYDPGFTPVLVAEALKLDDLNTRFAQQNPELVREQTRRRADWLDCRDRAQALRGQASRAMGKAVKGDSVVSATVDTASSAADKQGGVAAILRVLAGEIRTGATKAETKAKFARRKLTAAYATELEAAANALSAAEKALTAVASKVVTQGELDQQDGRVLLAIDHIWRAFRDAGALDSGIETPALGDIEGLFVHQASAKSSAASAPATGGADVPATPATNTH